MSVALVQIDSRKISSLKKMIKGLNGKIRIMKNEEDEEKEIMLKLIEESDESKEVSSAFVKKYFLTNGIKI